MAFVASATGARRSVVPDVKEVDDGSTQDIRGGDVMAIPPGHDAEVLGDEPCVMLDFGEISEYAKR